MWSRTKRRAWRRGGYLPHAEGAAPAGGGGLSRGTGRNRPLTVFLDRLQHVLDRGDELRLVDVAGVRVEPGEKGAVDQLAEVRIALVDLDRTL